MRLLMLMTIFVASPYLHAQQSMFETGDGRSGLYLRQSAVALNFGDSKVSAGYVHNYSTNPVFFGAGGYATANSGIASIFASDKPKAPEGGVDGLIGFRHNTHPPKNCGDNCDYTPSNFRFLFDGGFSRSSFYLYPTGVTPSANTSKTSFDRFRSVIGFNDFWGGGVLGIVGGAERRNNLSNLTAVNSDTVVAGTGGATNTVVKSQAGYYGTYKEYIGAPIYTDILLLGPFVNWKGTAVDHRLGFDLITRSDLAAVNRLTAGGLGIYLLDKKDNFKVIGGLSATYDGTKVQFSFTTGITGPAPK